MLKRNNKQGFTLVELIVVLVMFILFTVMSLGVVQSVAVAQTQSNRAMRDQIALRQALLIVTQEVRKWPRAEDSPGDFPDRYKVKNDNLVRTFDDESIIAQNVKSFSLLPNERGDKVEIRIESTNNEVAETQIYLRISS